MTSLFRKLPWWVRRRRKELELDEELQFHLEQEADERRASGLPADQAAWAARRDLGNVTRLREDTRTLWTWTLLEQLAQDFRYGLRTMLKNRTFTALAALSLALGIGANTAIYSFMDSILLRSLPVWDPASLVVMKWHAKPFAYGRSATNGSEFVLRSISGTFYDEPDGKSGFIFPFPAFERLQQASEPVLSSIFGYFKAGKMNVMVKGAAELATGQYVTGDFFRGLAVVPAAGRLMAADDDRAGAPPVAVISRGYSERRFGGAANAAGQSILINNLAFTVVGVTPSEFFGVDPATVPDVYLPLHAMPLFDSEAARMFIGQNYYWLQIMGRLRPGVSLEQAQAVLEPPFAQWVAPTADNDVERANLPVLRLGEGAGGLDTLRRQYSKPLYVLLAMVGLILAIACANTANLLLARATARRREIAVRLSLGAGRFRVVRQLLTESVLLASLSGALGILIAVAGMRVLTVLLANGQEGFTLHAELNWRVLVVTLALSVICGVLFGLAPALESTRPALMPTLKDRVSWPRPRHGGAFPRMSLTQTLVVAQIVVSLLMLVAAGLFVRTLSNLHSIPLGFNRENVLLFRLNAPQAGYPESRAAAFYADLRRRLSAIPGVRQATLSHESLIRAGTAYGNTLTIDGRPLPRDTRVLLAGPAFFTTMQIPLLRGREIGESDRPGTLPVAVVSDLFARACCGDEAAIGRHLRLARPGQRPVDLEIVGVAAAARYGPLKNDVPPVIYLPYAPVAEAIRLRAMTYALRTDGDPLRYVNTVRQIVHDADGRVPVTDFKTQTADIDQTINQEIVFARLCTAFAILALVISCVGLYATMAYAVARRTNEIGIRMALGARTDVVIWMVLREVCALAALGLAISVPIAIGSSRLVESFLFDMKPNDPRTLAVAVATLLGAALVAGYGPARRASRVNPIVALRHE
jgi:macrolide transport system ATP-binding/permease protein